MDTTRGRSSLTARAAAPQVRRGAPPCGWITPPGREEADLLSLGAQASALRRGTRDPGPPPAVKAPAAAWSSPGDRRATRPGRPARSRSPGRPLSVRDGRRPTRCRDRPSPAGNRRGTVHGRRRRREARGGARAAPSSHGHDVRFISTADPNAERGEFVAGRVDFGAGLPPPERARGRGTALWNRGAAGATAALIERFDPDLVHVHDIYPQLSVAPWRWPRLRVPVVQTLHNYELMSASPIDHRGRWLDTATRRGPCVARTALRLTRRTSTPRVAAWIVVSWFSRTPYTRHGTHGRGAENLIGSPRRAGGPPFEDRSGVVLSVGLPRVGHGVPSSGHAGPAPVEVIGRGPLPPRWRSRRCPRGTRPTRASWGAAEVSAAVRRRALGGASRRDGRRRRAGRARGDGGRVAGAVRDRGLADYVPDAGAARWSPWLRRP